MEYRSDFRFQQNAGYCIVMRVVGDLRAFQCLVIQAMGASNRQLAVDLHDAAEKLVGELEPRSAHVLFLFIYGRYKLCQ